MTPMTSHTIQPALRRLRRGRADEASVLAGPPAGMVDRAAGRTWGLELSLLIRLLLLIIIGLIVG